MLERADGVVEIAVVKNIVRLFAADAQFRAQHRHALVLGARLDRMPVGDAILRLLGAAIRAGVAQFGEFSLERAEALLRRIEAVEGGVGVGGRRDLAQDVCRFRRMGAVVDLGRHAGRRDAADRHMAGEGEHGIGQLDVALGQRLGAGEAAEFRHRIVGGIEAFVGGAFQPCDHRLGARGQPAVMDPERRIAAPGIIAFNCLAVGRALDAPVELFGRDDAAQLIGDLPVACRQQLVERAFDVEAAVGLARRRRRLLRARLLGGARGLGRRLRGRRRHGRCFAVTDRTVAVQRRRRRHDRFNSGGCAGSDRRRDDQCQHGAGKQTAVSMTHHSTPLKMTQRSRVAFTNRARVAPRTRLHRYYAPRRAVCRMKSERFRRLPSIKANAGAGR